MNKNNRLIWEKPWGYIEGFYVAFGIALSGFILQIVIGNLKLNAFQNPINLIFGAIFIIALLLFYIFFKRSHIVRWLSSIYSTVPALVVLLSIIIILGIVPQYMSHVDINNNVPYTLAHMFGWYQMTTTWTFVFVSYYNLIILGFTILNRTQRKLSYQDIGFYLNHIGLFLAFMGGMLGSADMMRMRMTVSEGNIEWRAQNQYNQIEELPIAIQLDTFMIEEYPPKLLLVDLETGKALPEKRPLSYSYDEKKQSTKLLDYNIDILSYLPSAAIMRDSLNTFAVPFHSDGATNALKIRVSNEEMNDPVVGWVSNGSFIFPHSVVYINDKIAVVMPMQEVKKYTSYIQVFTQDGKTQSATIEVNKPLRIAKWTIYQLSYDEQMGKYSTTSIFELVKDPWLPVVYIGIIMMILGAIYLFIVGPKKKRI